MIIVTIKYLQDNSYQIKNEVFNIKSRYNSSKVKILIFKISNLLSCFFHIFQINHCQYICILKQLCQFRLFIIKGRLGLTKGQLHYYILSIGLCTNFLIIIQKIINSTNPLQHESCLQRVFFHSNAVSLLLSSIDSGCSGPCKKKSQTQLLEQIDVMGYNIEVIWLERHVPEQDMV